MHGLSPWTRGKIYFIIYHCLRCCRKASRLSSGRSGLCCGVQNSWITLSTQNPYSSSWPLAALFKLEGVLIKVTFKFPAARMIMGYGARIHKRQSCCLDCSIAAMPNEISVRTDKGEYVGGDTVFGWVDHTRSDIDVLYRLTYPCDILLFCLSPQLCLSLHKGVCPLAITETLLQRLWNM